MWHGDTWTFTRPGVQDPTGDTQAGTTFTVQDCIFWPESEEATDFQRNTVVAHGMLAIPDSADVRTSDRPTSPTGEKFTIVGRSRWSGPHPLPGHVTGRQLFRVKGVT